MSESISVVLVSYKRPRELQEIIAHLKDKLPVGRIETWENNGSRGPNVGVLGRWEAARNAYYPVVYTQDDDAIVHNCAEILASFDGSRLTNGMKGSHFGIEYPVGPGFETLVGWGAVFHRDWIKPILDEYGRSYPQYRSEHLSFTCFDRIVTTLLRRKHNTILADVTDFPSATDPAISMHLQEGYSEDIIECRRRMESFPKEAPGVV